MIVIDIKILFRILKRKLIAKECIQSALSGSFLTIKNLEMKMHFSIILKTVVTSLQFVSKNFYFTNLYRNSVVG